MEKVVPMCLALVVGYLRLGLKGEGRFVLKLHDLRLGQAVEKVGKKEKVEGTAHQGEQVLSLD